MAGADRSGRLGRGGVATNYAFGSGGIGGLGGGVMHKGVSYWMIFWTLALVLFTVLQLFAESGRARDAALLEEVRGGIGGGSTAVHNSLYGADSTVLLKRDEDLTLEIFTSPKPFLGNDLVNNYRAIRSWLALKPKPRITLLGWEEGYEAAAKEFGLNLDTRVDTNFMGVPLFNSMLLRANESKATVTVIINGDILLFEDFVSSVRKVASRFQDFFFIAARYDVDDIPNVEFDEPNAAAKVREHVLREGTLHTYGGMDVWAWNTGGPRLFDTVMPHFVYGRGKYDNWMTHETIEAGRRHVVDASETSLTVHLRHDYHIVEGAAGGADAMSAAAAAAAAGDEETMDVPAAGADTAINEVVLDPLSASERLLRRPLGQFWSEGKKSKFELYVNIFLSLHAGTYTNQKGNVLFAPWKLALCMEAGGMCLQRRKRPGVCNCEYSAFVSATQTDPVVKEGSHVIRCGMVSTEAKEDFVIPLLPDANATEPAPFGLPLLLEPLAARMADSNNTVVLTALNFGYRQLMMNWVCNMRQLGVRNFVIAALDEELYRWAYVRGLPVYFETSITEGLSGTLASDATYGSDNFKLLTKMKSRVVLRVLKLGYNVVWTDCDIVWFQNAVPHLHGHDADLIIQSNAPDSEAPNGRRRMNSGFYLARSNARTIKAFEHVVAFAAHSTMSEQPCFYDVLCGRLGENRVGDNRCMYNSMTVEMLDRRLYPNGVTMNIWNTEPGQILRKYPDLLIIHNNWVKGAEMKQERFERHGFLFFDPHDELCSYPKI